MYDLAIIGGGPAGVAAGVYASRKRLKTVFIAKDFGGQSTVSEGVENWIGTIKISGLDFAKNLENHLRAYAGDIVDIKEGETVVSVAKGAGSNFVVKTAAGEYETKTVLITAGSHRRKLTAIGADRLEHKGITYCASCDGPLFANLDFAVVGGGNAGLETAVQLLAYCKSVTIFNRGDGFRGDPITVKKVLDNPKTKAIMNAEILEVKGDKSVSGLVYKDVKTNAVAELAVQGVFVEIGSLPSTEFAAGIIERDKFNQIVVDPRNQRARLLTPPEITSDARQGESDAGGGGDATVSGAQRLRNEADGAISGGVWAAGDCTNGLYHQNN